MNMIEAMTGAAEAQNEVVERPYEKSGAFIGGLAGDAERLGDRIRQGGDLGLTRRGIDDKIPAEN